MRRQSLFFFLGGDSWPVDRYAEEALRSRHARPGHDFVGHDEIVAGEAAPTTECRAGRLLASIRDHAGDATHVTVVGRSSGARIATLVAPEAARHCRSLLVVALAYPFRHPERDVEPQRFAHLATLGVPTLIVQGIRDEYGGPEILTRYPLSPAIEVMFVDAQHGLRLGSAEWDAVAARITEAADHAASCGGRFAAIAATPLRAAWR